MQAVKGQIRLWRSKRAFFKLKTEKTMQEAAKETSVHNLKK